mmetsp:Transcript_31855/g.98406  ORF Transcript_31855/g.98406 Transcript_31855/m.98406 type:complete len:110 (+) Transcript_31855:948-1277(+)
MVQQTMVQQALIQQTMVHQAVITNRTKVEGERRKRRKKARKEEVRTIVKKSDAARSDRLLLRKLCDRAGSHIASGALTYQSTNEVITAVHEHDEFLGVLGHGKAIILFF